MSGMTNLWLDLIEEYSKIEKDIIENKKEIFLRYNYYTRKYRGDLLNDVNVGLIADEYYRPVVQVFLRNKTGYIKKHIVFNRGGDEILSIETINFNLNE